MKKSTLNVFALLFVATFFSSCASYQGTSIVGSANLTTNNFRYVSTGVQGSITITRFLGFGGLGRQAMVAEAKKNLISRNQLKDGQALANISVDVKSSHFPFINTTRCTVTADIVEFNK